MIMLCSLYQAHKFVLSEQQIVEMLIEHRGKSAKNGRVSGSFAYSYEAIRFRGGAPQ
tara:strand:+ start:247 stop:417 length:171 start_codon:yes stop_codon:yes gene_type:complete